MERMIAWIRSNWRSSISTSRSLLPMPGIMPSIPLMSPIFLIWRNWSSISFKSNEFSRSFLASCSASRSEICCSARSMSDITSPMPRIRDAMRSGWNTSRLSSFSPVPTNLMGCPVTSRTDSAAPPRVSPSSFVRITPVMPNASWNSFATRTASWPIIASITNRISWGSTADLTFLSSFISSSSICRRPAVSRMM